MERRPWEASSCSTTQEFPNFCGIRWFIIAFTRDLHRSLSWARWLESVLPHFISLLYTLTLSSHLRLGLPGCLFPSGFPTNTICAFLCSRISATYPTYLILFDLIILIISPASCHFIHLGFKFFPQHPVLKHSQCVPLWMSETKFLTHNKLQTDLCILTSALLDGRREGIRVWTYRKLLIN
jgi:hypothetical protein